MDLFLKAHNWKQFIEINRKKLLPVVSLSNIYVFINILGLRV